MITNFRRVTGTDKEGKHCRDLYRCGSLVHSTYDDIQMMRDCRIKHIVDLRSDEECEADPYQLPDDFTVHHVSALKTRDGLENFYFLMLLHKDSTSEEIQEAAAFVREGYRNLPFHNPALKKILALMEQEDGAILFHCSSGKDRTGVLAALIQKILGISDEEIMKEYLISNDYVREETLLFADTLGYQGSQRDTLLYVCQVHQELLQSSLDEIERKYADWAAYFKVEYGLDKNQIEQLRQRYLE